jgi:hypothetical protein
MVEGNTCAREQRKSRSIGWWTQKFKLVHKPKPWRYISAYPHNCRDSWLIGWWALKSELLHEPKPCRYLYGISTRKHHHLQDRIKTYIPFWRNARNRKIAWICMKLHPVILLLESLWIGCSGRIWLGRTEISSFTSLFAMASVTWLGCQM